MNEKLRILKLLEDGRINADEAERLLQAAGVSGEPSPQSQGEYKRDRGANNNNYTTPIGSRISADKFASELGRKFETLTKDMEPKLQKFVGVVAEKTADVADRISRNINEAESRPRTSAGTQKYIRPAGVTTPASGPRNFELKVESGYNELNLMAHNGDIIINGYNGDKITVKVFAKESRAGARLELMRLGGRYYLNYDTDEFNTVSIDAIVPEKMFSSIVMGAGNGRTEAVNVSADYFTVKSSNGEVSLKQIKSDNINLDTSNGVLRLDNISGKNAHIEGSNGAVDARYLDIENLHLVTSNSPVNAIATDFVSAAEYTWVVESSNGKITLNVPSSPRVGYHVKASTSLGNVRLGLPGLKYVLDTSYSAEAFSQGYDNAATRVRISAETSNAALSIN